MNDTTTTEQTSIHDKVRDYYGETLKSSADLRTTACCSPSAMPAHLRETASMLHPEVTGRFYGCGSPIPDALEAATVLDLGCGTGRDVYLLSRMVGAMGRVIGVDMTAAQLAVAERHRQYHARKFGHPCGNVELLAGDLAALDGLGIADDSVDVVVSSGNSADMLSATRYAPHFRIDGDKQHHRGLFECAAPTSREPTGGPCC